MPIVTRKELKARAAKAKRATKATGAKKAKCATTHVEPPPPQMPPPPPRAVTERRDRIAETRKRRAALMADEDYMLAVCQSIAAKHSSEDNTKLRAVALAHKIVSKREEADMMKLLIRVTDKVRSLVAKGYEPDSVLQSVADKLECVAPIYRTFILSMARSAAQDALPSMDSNASLPTSP